MGNGESLLKQRLNDIDDLNTVALNFVGGDGSHPLEFMPPLPADKMVIASLQKSKDPIDAFQIDTNQFIATNENNMKDVYHSIMHLLIEKKKRMDYKIDGNEDKFASLIGQKYNN